MIVKHIAKWKTEVSPRKKVQMRRRHRIGTLIAYKERDNIKFGWSLVNFTEGDKFNNATGVEEATKRAISIHALNDGRFIDSLPVKIKNELLVFRKRIAEYFKISPF
jgi:hypothetical protein